MLAFCWRKWGSPEGAVGDCDWRDIGYTKDEGSMTESCSTNLQAGQHEIQATVIFCSALADKEKEGSSWVTKLTEVKTMTKGRAWFCGAELAYVFVGRNLRNAA